MILVLLKPCDWKIAPFARLPRLPDDLKPITACDDRDEAWETVAKNIRGVIESMLSASPHEEEAGSVITASGSNPFEFGSTVPSERFVGRRAQRADVKGRIGGISAQSLSLVGLPRSGKSSLLRYIAEKSHDFCTDEQKPLVVALDLGSKLFHTPEGILEGLRRAIESQTGTSPWRRDQSEDGFAVNDGLESLSDRRVRLVVLLDDFERISARLDRFQGWGEGQPLSTT